MFYNLSMLDSTSHPNFRIYVEPWDDSRRYSEKKSLKYLGISLMAVGIIALLAEITYLALLINGVLPHSGWFGWLEGLQYLQTFFFVATGSGLIVLGGLLLKLREKILLSTAEKAKRAGIAKLKPDEGFKATDKPPFTFYSWPEGEKPRVLVISSDQGGGHKTAAASVEAALKTHFTVFTTFPTTQISGCEWFDYFQKHGYHKTQRWLVGGQKCMEFLGVCEKMHKQIEQDIYLTKPQLVISVQPISNAYIAEVCSAYKTPFVVVPTDYKTDHFFYGFNGADDNFRVGLPLDDPQEAALLADRYKFEEKHLKVTGYPVRPAFQNQDMQEEVAELREHYGIKEHDHVVTLSMGMQGGAELENYCRLILETDTIGSNMFEEEMHLFALCGRNEELLNKLELLSQEVQSKEPKNKNKRITLHPIGLCDQNEMAAYIASADVYITKPGGASTSEGLSLGTYLMFDQKSAKATPWEPVNIEKVEERGGGEAIDPRIFIPQLRKVLSGGRSQSHVDFPGRHFGENILTLATELTGLQTNPPEVQHEEGHDF